MKDKKEKKRGSAAQRSGQAPGSLDGVERQGQHWLAGSLT
jgi:hypothetical protein